MHINGVLRVSHPRGGKALPFLVDSPHSGRQYPDDFGFICQRRALQKYEDRFVELLLANLNQLGATVLQAEAPRSYIDLNRAVDDIAPAQLANPWDGPFKLRPSLNCNRGTGLIWTHAGDVPLYDAPLASAAVQARIETYYWPYYEALERESAALRQRFGRVWHINMHSMPPNVNNGQSDIVLGDLDGTSCNTGFLRVIENGFKAHGLRVAYNDPYKGAQLVRTLGQPDQGRESLQIELSKGLYMRDDLLTLEPGNFAKLQDILDEVMRGAAAFIADQLSKTPEKVDLRASSSASIEADLPKAAREVTP